MDLEEELQSVLRRKKSLSEGDVRALGAALHAFQSSARYDLIGPLPLSQFLKGKPGGLRKLSRRSLTEIASAGLSGLCLTDGLSNAAIKKLAQILATLHGDTTQAGSSKAKVFSLPHLRAVPDRADPSRSAAMSSIEAEQKLEDAIYQLRRSPRFEELADCRLGDFWTDDAVSAPFEKSITFRQFSEMKVRALLEKRSFGPSKIVAVIAAVQKALASTAHEAPRSHPVPIQTTQPQESSGTPIIPVWRGDGHHITTQSKLLLLLYSHEAARVAGSVGPLARIIREIPRRLLAREFLAAWYLQEFSEDVVAQFLYVDRNEALALCDQAYTKLDKLISEVAAELRSYWEIALRGPGIGSEKLIEIFREPLLSEEFQLGLCQVLLGSTGARHPIVFGEDLRHYWSKSPSALQMALTGMISSFPKTDSAVQEEIDAVFPFFDRTVIVSILRRQAYFRERDRVWVKHGDDRA